VNAVNFGRSGPARANARDAVMTKTMLLTAAAGLAALLVQAGLDGVAAQSRTTLDIYVVDVEGGNATLFVAPSGESLLIDTGNVAPSAAIRDAGRIVAAARDARPGQRVEVNGASAPVFPSGIAGPKPRTCGGA
jgi:hypothetical protein